MIKTPVSYDDSENVFYPSPQVEDADGSFIFECKDKQVAQEIVKRINMHDDLVKSLQFLTGIVGGNFCQDMVIKRKYKEARELLEKCK
jgi:hypothetical protein